jgi:hypothetical protein
MPTLSKRGGTLRPRGKGDPMSERTIPTPDPELAEWHAGRDLRAAPRHRVPD